MVWMVYRRIVRGRFGKTRKQRGFVESELFRGLAEIKLRGGFEAVDAVTQVDLVGVQSEDLLLGETALDLDGKKRLLNLAMPRTVRREKQIARQLHGQGGGALHFPTGQ